MNSKTSVAALAAFLFLAPRLPAQAKPNPYPHMAPVEQYLMPRADEVALARSAAPAAVSDHATVLVLTAKGYVSAAQGSNGFVCLVERAWDSSFHAPTFWNPKIRGANCLNAAAARSVLPYFELRAKLALARHSQDEIKANMETALAAHQLPKLEPDSVSYMMSKHSYLTNSGGNLAHVMFFVPDFKSGALGENLPGSPLSVAGKLDLVPVSIVVVSTPQWSDGSSAN